MKIVSPQYDFIPLIIIGAARSGTKLLRDLIALHPAIDKVPYDINYIWRIGNEQLGHDELSPHTLTEFSQQRIQQKIGLFTRKAPVLVEKTVSNCLRVPFIDKVYPDAYYIHLVRNGFDVVESVHRQWTVAPDWTYLLQKARTFPVLTAPRYAMVYAKNMVKQLAVPNSESSRTWGPRYKGIEADLETRTLLEVCAFQWVRSVESATNDLTNLSERIGGKRILTIQYEEFVAEPLLTLEKIATHIDLEPESYRTIKLPEVQQNNIGKGIRNMDASQVELVSKIIDKVNADVEHA